MLGWSPQEVDPDVATIEAQLGRSFTGTRRNLNLDSTATSMSAGNNDYDAGYTHYFRNSNAQTGSPKTPIPWNDYVAGTHDGVLTSMGTAILASRYTDTNPMILSIHHEQTINTTSQKGYTDDVVGNPGCNTDATPAVATAEYQAFNQYCRGFFDDMKVSKWSTAGAYIGGPCTYAFPPWAKMWISPDTGLGAADFYPGDEYVDYVGMDGYNPWLTTGGGGLKWGASVEDFFAPVQTFAAAHGKDWIIPEFGVDATLGGADGEAAKAQWMRDMRTYLKGLGATSPGVCRGLWLTLGTAYKPSTSQASLDAFRDLALDPYFG